MLSLALEECVKLGIDKVLVSCREENIGSRKVIVNNGGVYEGSYYRKERGFYYRRYWIDVEKVKVK